MRQNVGEFVKNSEKALTQVVGKSCEKTKTSLRQINGTESIGFRRNEVCLFVLIFLSCRAGAAAAFACLTRYVGSLARQVGNDGFAAAVGLALID